MRSPAVNDSPSLIQRWRFSGTSRLSPIRSHMNQFTMTVAFGAGSHQRVQVAGVVDVVVADEDPLDVLGLDDAEHVVQELVTVLTHPRVDDDRLRGLDDH